MTTVNPLVQHNVFSNLVSTLESAPSSWPSRDTDNITSYITEAIAQNNEARMSRAINSLLNKYQEALTLIRKNMLETAERYIQKADEFADMLEGDSKNIVLTFAYSTKAYYEYKKKDFSASERILRNAFNIDSALEKKGYSVLAIHRVQLLHNLCRVYLKRDDSQWVRLSLLLLNSLASNDSLRYRKFYLQNTRLQCVPNHLRSGIYYQVLNESVYHILLRYNAVDKIEDVLRTTRKNLYTSSEVIDKQPIENWLKINESYVQNNVTLFLEGVHAFLLEDKVDTIGLRLHVLLLISIKIKELLPAGEYRLLLKAIVQYAQQHLRLNESIVYQVLNP